MKFRFWILLVIVQLVWAGSYIAMKLSVAELPIGVTVFLRYGIASVAFFIGGLGKALFRFQKRDLMWIAVLGLLDFTLAPFLQVKSLTLTTAVDASILISFEPMITVLVAAALLRENPSRNTWIALLVATLGMFILSFSSDGSLASADSVRLLGNVLFLSSLFCEAGVTVSGRPLTQKYSPFHLMGALIFAGFLGSIVVYGPQVVHTDFSVVSAKAWGAMFFLSLGCSVFGYTAWYHVLKTVPVNKVALSLFLQPVMGSVMGVLILNETVSIRTLLGALIVCGALAWWQTNQMKAKK